MGASSPISLSRGFRFLLPTLGPAVPGVNGDVRIALLNAPARVLGGIVFGSEVAALPPRPRPRSRLAAGGGSSKMWLSSDGRPAARQGIRIPQDCGTARRRVFPCRRVRRPRRVLRHLARQPFGTRRAARRPAPRAHGNRSPSARHVAPRPGVRHAGRCARQARFPAPGVSPGRWWYAPVRALPRMWRTVPLRCVDRLGCSCAARHWFGTRRCRHSPGSSSRLRRPQATT